MLEIIQSYYPQRIFLAQGDESSYRSLCEAFQTDGATIHSLAVPRLTMEHARMIATFAVEGDGNERMCIVFFSVFSPESAEVLLKSLEEPDPLTGIVFITPYPYLVPITIRSRVMLLQTTRAALAPIQMTRTQAFDYVKKELSSEGADDAATRRAGAVGFLDQLEAMYVRDPRKARVIYDAKRMLFRANLPTKFVMEYVIAAVL